MSTTTKSGGNAGTINRQQYLEQQRNAQAYIGQWVSHYFSSGNDTMTSRDFLGIFGAGAMGGIGTATQTGSSNPLSNPATRRPHRKATPAQRAALERARAAAAKARSK